MATIKARFRPSRNGKTVLTRNRWHNHPSFASPTGLGIWMDGQLIKAYYACEVVDGPLKFIFRIISIICRMEGVCQVGWMLAYLACRRLR